MSRYLRQGLTQFPYSWPSRGALGKDRSVQCILAGKRHALVNACLREKRKEGKAARIPDSKVDGNQLRRSRFPAGTTVAA